MKSAQFASITCRGIDGNLADSGSCATHAPPTTLMACAPAVPFEPMPLSTMQIARSRCSTASDRKKSSTGRLWPGSVSGLPSRSRPSASVIVKPGRIT